MTEITYITVDEWDLVEEAFNKARAAFGEGFISNEQLKLELAKFGIALEATMPDMFDAIDKSLYKLNACEIDNRLELAVDRLGVEMKRAKLEPIGGYDYRKHEKRGKRNDSRRSSNLRR
jgi:hypothetical protein